MRHLRGRPLSLGAPQTQPKAMGSMRQTSSLAFTKQAREHGDPKRRPKSGDGGSPHRGGSPTHAAQNASAADAPEPESQQPPAAGPAPRLKVWPYEDWAPGGGPRSRSAESGQGVGGAARRPGGRRRSAQDMCGVAQTEPDRRSAEPRVGAGGPRRRLVLNSLKVVVARAYQRLRWILVRRSLLSAVSIQSSSFSQLLPS